MRPQDSAKVEGPRNTPEPSADREPPIHLSIFLRSAAPARKNRPADRDHLRYACAVLATCALSACALLHHVPAPLPGQPADLAAMTSVVEHTKARPPHRGFPLVVAPVTVSYEPDRYLLGLRPEFAAAVADLESKSGRIEPIRPPILAGVLVRRMGVYDPYDIEQYLLIRLSPVGFSADSARAALVVVYDCGSGCGSRFGVGLRRATNRGWRVAQFRLLQEPAQ